MNFSRLAKYFSGKLPNSERIDISEFVKILGNIDIEGDFISEYGAKFGAIKSDYEGLFKAIYKVENGDNHLYAILKYFELSKSFIEIKEYEEYIVLDRESENLTELIEKKSELLQEVVETLSEINKSHSNKANGNKFEALCEKLLLQSSYFHPGFREFSFEDGTEKIDRLLRLKRDIGNFGKETGYLGYVILEAKYKKKGVSGAGEVAQLKSYIERLKDYGVSKYTIVITSTAFKATYRTIIGDYCKKQVLQNDPVYLSLLTIDDIQVFLKNEGDYKNMTFDDFIERSFIRWLK